MQNNTSSRRQRLQFERDIRRDELQVLRFWQDFNKHPKWKDVPNDRISRIKLFIHELIALKNLRETGGGKRVNIPKISEDWKKYEEHAQLSYDVLVEAREILDKMEEGEDKVVASKNFIYCKAAYMKVRDMVNGDEVNGDEDNGDKN